MWSKRDVFPDSGEACQSVVHSSLVGTNHISSRRPTRPTHLLAHSLARSPTLLHVRVCFPACMRAGDRRMYGRRAVHEPHGRGFPLSDGRFG